MKKKKVLFHQDNAPITTMEKSHKFYCELLPHPLYSLDLAPSDYYLFADLKRMLQGKKFRFNEEAIGETKACSKTKDISFYKKGIKTLEKC